MTVYTPIRPVAGSSVTPPVTLAGPTAASTPLSVAGVAGQTAPIFLVYGPGTGIADLQVFNTGGVSLANAFSIGPSGIMQLFSSAGNDSYFYLNPPAGRSAAIVYGDSNGNLWQFYHLGGDNNFYFRDLVNARMHMTFTPAATVSTAVTTLNSAVNMLGALQFIGQDAGTAHTYAMRSGIANNGAFDLSDQTRPGEIFTVDGSGAAFTLFIPLRLNNRPAFVAGDHYLVCDASGNVHVSATGPAS